MDRRSGRLGAVHAIIAESVGVRVVADIVFAASSLVRIPASQARGTGRDAGGGNAAGFAHTHGASFTRSRRANSPYVVAIAASRCGSTGLGSALLYTNWRCA